MTRRGFSLVEMVVVVIVIGIVAAFFFPRLGRQLHRQEVRAARSAVTSMHALARATAIHRGRTVRLIRNGNQFLILATHPVTGVPDTVSQNNLFTAYGVTVTSNRDTLVFDPRGLGTEPSPSRIVVARAGFADTVAITPVGSILQ